MAASFDPAVVCGPLLGREPEHGTWRLAIRIVVEAYIRRSPAAGNRPPYSSWQQGPQGPTVCFP
jgi:hypothetical protein